MAIVSLHDSLLIFSGLTSVVGIGYTYASALKDPTESEAMQETLVRLTFVYWSVFCSASLAVGLGDRIVPFFPNDVACRLKLLTLLSFMLTFCCLLSLPLHLIEQHQQAKRQLARRQQIQRRVSQLSSNSLNKVP